MFDRSKKLPVRLIRQEGDIRTFVSFPTDQQIIDRANARRIMITDLGRGHEKIEQQKPEHDLELVKNLLDVRNADITQREADRILQGILTCQVLSCDRTANGFEVEISHPALEEPFKIALRVPTSSQLDDFENRYSERKLINSKQQSVQMNYGVASALWTDLAPGVDLPVNWKSVVIQAVSQKISELSASFEDPT